MPINIRPPVRTPTQDELCNDQGPSMCYCAKFNYNSSKECPGTCKYFRGEYRRIKDLIESRKPL